MPRCATPASRLSSTNGAEISDAPLWRDPQPGALPMSSCLVAIHDRLAELIHLHEPDCCALESVIYVQSHKTAITLGAARGAAILAAAERGLPVFEYAPKRIKQATVGSGGGRQKSGRFHGARVARPDRNAGAGRGRCARDRSDASARAGSMRARSAGRQPDMNRRAPLETRWLGRIVFARRARAAGGNRGAQARASSVAG